MNQKNIFIILLIIATVLVLFFLFSYYFSYYYNNRYTLECMDWEDVGSYKEINSEDDAKILILQFLTDKNHSVLLSDLSSSKSGKDIYNIEVSVGDIHKRILWQKRLSNISEINVPSVCYNSNISSCIPQRFMLNNSRIYADINLLC